MSLYRIAVTPLSIPLQFLLIPYPQLPRQATHRNAKRIQSNLAVQEEINIHGLGLVDGVQMLKIQLSPTAL